MSTETTLAALMALHHETVAAAARESIESCRGGYDKASAALESALRAALKGQAWRPIETAPKDRYIILTDGKQVGFGLWVTDADHGADWEGQLGMAGWALVDWLGPEEPKITLWQPVPAPPVEGEQPT